jgi:hypothetical protein
MIVNNVRYGAFLFLILLSLLTSCGGNSEKNLNETIGETFTEDTNSIVSIENTNNTKEINLSLCGDSCAIASNDNGLFIASVEGSYNYLGNLTILQIDNSFQPKQGIKIDLKSLFNPEKSSYALLRLFSGTGNNLYLYLIGGRTNNSSIELTEGYLIVINTNERFNVSKILKFIPKKITSLNSELDFQKIITDGNLFYIEGPGLFWIFDKNFNLVNKFKIWNGYDYYLNSSGYEYFFGLNSADLFNNNTNETIILTSNNYRNYNYYSTLLDEDNSLLVSGGYYSLNDNYDVPFFSIFNREFSYHKDFIIPELECHYTGFYLVLKHGENYLLIGNSKETNNGEPNSTEEGLIVVEIGKDGNLLNNIFLPNINVNMMDKSSSFSDGEKIFVRTTKGILILDSNLNVINTNSEFTYRKLNITQKDITSNFSLQKKEGFCLATYLDGSCVPFESLETDLQYIDPNTLLIDTLSPTEWTINF